MNNILFITRYYGEMLGGTMCSQRNIDSLKKYTTMYMNIVSRIKMDLDSISQE